MAKPAFLRVSTETYLREERARLDGRAELLDGEVVMTAGATRRHNRVTRDILTALDRRLGDGPCEALVNDMKVRAKASEAYTYPDVVVTCDEPEFEDADEDVLTNPLAIFEVPSPSTQSRDRGDKFASYRTIPSLRHYVLVASDERTVDHYARQERDVWLLTTLRGDDALRLDPPGVELPLAEIYRRAGL